MAIRPRTSDPRMPAIYKVLGRNADKKVMSARLAGLTTQDLVALMTVGALPVASKNWDRARAVMGIVKESDLWEKVISSSLSIQEIQKLSQEGKLSGDVLDTILVLEERGNHAVGSFGKIENERQKPLSQRLREAEKRVIGRSP